MSGSYGDTTLINFISSSFNAGTHDIVLHPKVAFVSDEPTELSRLRSGLYFIKSGLERRFIVNLLPVPDPSTEQLLTSSYLTLDGVAIALPVGYKGLEVGSNRTTIPDPVSRVGNITYFATVVPSSTNRIEMRYQVPPTAWQRLVLKKGLTLIVLLLVPFFALSFLPEKDTQKPRLRRTLIWTLTGVQLLLLASLVAIAFIGDNGGGSEIWIDFGIGTIGALAQGAVLYVKKDSVIAKANLTPNPGPQADA